MWVVLLSRCACVTICLRVRVNMWSFLDDLGVSISIHGCLIVYWCVFVSGCNAVWLGVRVSVMCESVVVYSWVCLPLSSGSVCALAEGQLQRGVCCLDSSEGIAGVCGISPQVIINHSSLLNSPIPNCITRFWKNMTLAVSKYKRDSKLDERFRESVENNQSRSLDQSLGTLPTNIPHVWVLKLCLKLNPSENEVCVLARKYHT